MNGVQLTFVLGPTASGKSAFAIELAQKKSAEIINADSIQVYRSLNIGSAKPSPEELEKIPHHLIGHVPDGENYTAGRFRKDVLEIIERRSSIVNNFLIVGGSGFYIKALINGLYEIPEVPLEIRNQIQSEDPIKLYEELAQVDPVSYQRIHANDSYRISRAVEVYRAFQIPFSEFLQKFSETKIPYAYKKIGLAVEKELIRMRVATRAQKMIDSGLIEETQNLLDQGYHHWAALQSVGYREVVQFLRGELTRDLLLEEIVKNTMGLVKRQMTWFKKDHEIEWIEIGK